MATKESNLHTSTLPPSWMIISAERYALGRMTYIVSVTADWLVEHWREIDLCTRIVIKTDVEEAFKRDDADRDEFRRGENKYHVFALGHDCDRASWQRVRNLWQK